MADVGSRRLDFPALLARESRWDSGTSTSSTIGHPIPSPLIRASHRHLRRLEIRQR